MVFIAYGCEKSQTYYYFSTAASATLFTCTKPSEIDPQERAVAKVLRLYNLHSYDV